MEISINENGTIYKKSKIVEYIDIPESNNKIANVIENIDIYTPDMNIDTIKCIECLNIAKDLWTEKTINDYKLSIQ